MRRAQAALEFLTTYGWAFIVILVMIGALAYFGVLSPSKITPNRCLVEAGFECKDYRITQNTVNLLLANRKGDGMSISGWMLTTDQTGVSVGVCTPATPGTPITVTSDGMINLSCSNMTGLSTSLGDKLKFNFLINYTMAKGTYMQQATGSIYATVQP